MKRLQRPFNSPYSGTHLTHVAFPLGGMGAGMVCLEGTGSFNHVSIRHTPGMYNEPTLFGALTVLGKTSIAKVLEGPVPKWKIFGPGPGQHSTGLGGKTYGLPRFAKASFAARFPFGTVSLTDPAVPLQVKMTGWSPFVPSNADDSSLPVVGVEYEFTNRTRQSVKAMFSFHARNMLAFKDGEHEVLKASKGFTLVQHRVDQRPELQGWFNVTVNEPSAKFDYVWFRGGWYDALSILWNNIAKAKCPSNPPVDNTNPSPGASLWVPFSVKPRQQKTIRILFAWYVPQSHLRVGWPEPGTQWDNSTACQCKAPAELCKTYRPWYADRFANISEVTAYWNDNYDRLRKQSSLFSQCLSSSTLPPEVLEAVSTNLCILKSPTILRQTDGRLWGWEGCCEDKGCCSGTCTHVWNYAQAIAHLFPTLEQDMRDTEFNEGLYEDGFQTFRVPLPIGKSVRFGPKRIRGPIAAADGQLGCIIKAYRDWRINGKAQWIAGLWPKLKKNLDYCIKTWDPRHTGALEEPHHNTYDIEFWGPDSMCTSIYAAALAAFCEIGNALSHNVEWYKSLLKKTKQHLENRLFNGQYFEQKIQWKNLNASNPAKTKAHSLRTAYSPEALKLVQKQGPKYQYGKGCLSDGMIGAWMAQAASMGNVLDRKKVTKHLLSVYKYNLRKNLVDHANPQRPGYAMAEDGGLLLCSWPRGGEPVLPFVYSNEVWTGIEYQVASHLMMMGRVKEGLKIVRTCRKRYDGSVRNPFDEYECGHWYARAMASYALLQGMTGIRYDAVDKTLYIKPSIRGDFKSFLSTATGFGNVGVRKGKPFIDMKYGSLDVQKIEYVPFAKKTK